MGRVALLGVLLVGAAVLFIALKPSAGVEQEKDTLTGWDMRQEIQKASDTERNPWKREMDM